MNFFIKRVSRTFAKSNINTVPNFDLEAYIKNPAENQKLCEDIAESFHKFGAVAIKDPRVPFQKNEVFLTMMEKYFLSRSKMIENGAKIDDIFPEHGYNVGLTPEKLEKARGHQKFIDSLINENLPKTPQPTPKDCKCRFMYPLNEREEAISEIDGAVFIPQDIPNFKTTMDGWGNSMMDSVNLVSEMTAQGLGFEKNFFTNKLQGGAHLLAPTGSDLTKYEKNDIFAGLHYDFSFMTIHGKSRFPGLYIWLRTGEKIPVSIPDGYLLLQSGKELEMMTGGYIPSGMHEVYYDQKCSDKVQSMDSKENIWRVSSTVFAHLNNDTDLAPVGKYRTKESIEKYPSMTAYELKEIELTAINLFGNH